MTYPESTLPFLPLLVPLGGVFLIWILPNQRAFPYLKRALYVATLVICGILFLIPQITRGTARSGLYSLGSGSPFAYEPLSFSFDPLASTFGFLLAGALALVSIALLARPKAHFEPVTLLLLAASLGVCSATNLITLCLTWALLDLALLGLQLTRAPEESIPHAIRHIQSGLLSTVVLVIATALVMSQNTSSELAHLAEVDFMESLQAGLPLKLLMLAALLRLNVYPLPGSLKRRWEVYLVSLCTGGYLWLRLASLMPQGLPHPEWLIVFSGGVLLVTGLLAGLSADLATALPYLLLNGATAIILGPLLHPSMGFAVALITAVNLGLCLALLRIDVQVRPAPPLGRRVRLPLAIALCSLAGWPLTLGFAAHWSLLQLGWMAGSRYLVLAGSLAYALASIPIWKRLRQILREVGREPKNVHWMAWIPLACATAIAVMLVMLTFLPGLIIRPWADSLAQLDLSYLGMWTRVGWRLPIILFIAVALVPLLGSYALEYLQNRAMAQFTVVFDALSTLLELDWLYAAIESVSARLGGLITQMLTTVEEAFYLAWTLLWGLMIVLYLLQG